MSETTSIPRQPFVRALAVVFGGTLAVQAIAFLRQLVIAAAFGVDRTMDLYVLVLSVATVIGFGLGSVMENATVPMLVARLEEKDREGFRQIALRVMLIGAALGIAVSVVFLLSVPVVAHLVTTGLSAAEKASMAELAWWFVPWVAIATPYYAAGSLLKAESRFRRFMAAEVVVTLVSLAIIYVWHPGVHAIPLAYAGGYAVAFLTMVPGLPIAYRLSHRDTGRSWGVVRQVARFGTVSQAAAVGTFVDRFLASHLPPGAISAGSYAALITGQASALLAFREAFMVPLSEADRRAEKLERMMIGLLMLSIPLAVFLSARADAVVGVLLERGRFDSAAVALAAQMMAIQALAIPVGAVLLPLYRTLQIIGRMRYAGYLLLFNAGATLAIGLALVFWLRLGLWGYLLTGVIASHLTFVLALGQLRLAGVRPALARPLLFAAYAFGASAAGVVLAGAVPIEGPRFLVLLKDGVAFGAVYAVCCLALYRPLRRIIGDIRASAAATGELRSGPGTVMDEAKRSDAPRG